MSDKENAEAGLEVLRNGSMKFLYDVLIGIIRGELDDFINLPDASTPLSAPDFFRLWQNGVARNLTVEQLLAEIGGPPPAQLSPPVNVIPPVITDTPRVGVAITVTPGSWSGNPIPTITRRWTLNDVIIPGATGLTYTPVSGDVNKILNVVETAFNSEAPSGVAFTSNDAGPVDSGLTADQTVQVFASMVDGAVIAKLSAGVTLSGSHPGVSITVNGDLYISDSTLFFPALPLVVETSGPDIGCVINSADYYNLDPLADNISLRFDSVDQRTVLVDESTSSLIEWADPTDSARRARNDVYPTVRPSWKRDSAAGVGRPGVSFDPVSITSVYGLFFQDAPTYAGIQRLTVSSTQIPVRFDNWYSPNLGSQANLPNPIFSISSNAATGKMCVVSIESNKDTGVLRCWLNGTPLTALTGWPFAYNVMACFVFYSDFNTATQIFSSAALGQASPWKSGAAFRGDIFDIITLLDAVPAP